MRRPPVSYTHLDVYKRQGPRCSPHWSTWSLACCWPGCWCATPSRARRSLMRWWTCLLRCPPPWLVFRSPPSWRATAGSVSYTHLDVYKRQALLHSLGGCLTWSVESENRPQRGQFLPDLQSHSMAMGQKDGEKWTAAANLQPTISKSDRLLAAIPLPLPHHVQLPPRLPRGQPCRCAQAHGAVSYTHLDVYKRQVRGT